MNLKTNVLYPQSTVKDARVGAESAVRKLDWNNYITTATLSSGTHPLTRTSK
jgi:hypothetical protein